MNQSPLSRPNWSSRWVFILATSGSAVGLGNIWKFPYMVGQNGGAAFVLAYLVCIIVIAMPILMAEIMLGRRGQANSVTTMKKLSQESQGSLYWQVLAWTGLVSGFLILSFYSVVAGWIMSFAWQTSLGDITQLPIEAVSKQFSALVSSPSTLIFWHSVFMLLTVTVVAKGVSAGIGKINQILMPALLIMLFGLFVYGILKADFSTAFNYMFAFDSSKLNAGVLVSSIGHAFFTLSLGMGAVMVYGSYLPKNTSVVKMSFSIILIDTIIALIVGMVIFPLVFQFDLQAGGGPGLIFQTLPVAFAQMPNGMIFGTLFFVLLLFAAITSAISMLEPIVAWLSESRKLSRTLSAILLGAIVWLLGIACALSFNDWAFSFQFLGAQKDTGLFDVFDLLTSNILLPLGGVLIAVFSGWVMHEKISAEELKASTEWFGDKCYAIWRISIRYLSPIAISVVLFYQLLSSLF